MCYMGRLFASGLGQGECDRGASELHSARGCLAHTCTSRGRSTHLQALLGPGSAARQEGSGLLFKTKQRQAGADQEPQDEGRRGCQGQTAQAPRAALSHCGPQVCRLLAWASFTCKQGPCRTRMEPTSSPLSGQGKKLGESKQLGRSYTANVPDKRGTGHQPRATGCPWATEQEGLGGGSPQGTRAVVLRWGGTGHPGALVLRRGGTGHLG